MLSFKIDSLLTKRLIDLNDRISDQFHIIKALSQRERDALHRFARISMIGASTRIENAVLTDPEIDWIDTVLTEDAKQSAFDAHRSMIIDKLSKDRERSLDEVAGCRTMLNLVYEQGSMMFPLQERMVRALHHELMRHDRRTGMAIGGYKTSPNTVVKEELETGQRTVVFKTADPGLETETQMSQLIAWYNETIPSEPWSLAVISEFVYRFLAIHPFQDGNGRLGRGLFLLGLLQSKDEKIATISPYLAIDRQIERHKEEYYFVLQQCSGGKFKADPLKYQTTYFLSYIIKVLSNSLDDIDIYRRKNSLLEKLSPSALKALECFKEKPELKLTPREIEKETGLPRRTLSRVLSDLKKKEFIQSYGLRSAIRYQLIF